MMSEHNDTRAIFNKYAKSYLERYADQSEYSEVLDHFMQSLEVGSRVLDLGCGPGNVSRHLLNSRPDLAITGIDVSEEMIALAGSHCPEAEFIHGDLHVIKGISSGYFSGIVLAFLLPYIPPDGLEDLFSECKRILSRKGNIYLSFLATEHEPWQRVVSEKGTDKLTMYFYNSTYVVTLLNKLGLEVFSQKRPSPEVEKAESDEIKIIMLIKSS